MKKCYNCFKIKPLEDFYPKRVGSKDPAVNRQGRCKACNWEVVRYYHQTPKKQRVEAKAIDELCAL